jgi:hypothetical protein
MLPASSGWGSMDLWNIHTLPQHDTASQPSEDGGSKVLRNVGILPQHYKASQRRPRLETKQPWECQTHLTRHTRILYEFSHKNFSTIDTYIPLFRLLNDIDSTEWLLVLTQEIVSYFQKIRHLWRILIYWEGGWILWRRKQKCFCMPVKNLAWKLIHIKSNLWTCHETKITCSGVGGQWPSK